MFDCDEQSPDVHETDVRFLDEQWMKGHVAAVGQQGASGVVILDGGCCYWC
jgi:hypothetical protein